MEHSNLGLLESQRSFVSRLVDFGLTPKQAEIYLVLLANGPADVRFLSSHCRMHRSDVYRKLKELQENEMVDCEINSPSNKYVAAPPQVVLDLLKDRMNESIEKVSSNSAQLALELMGVMKVTQSEGKTEEILNSNFSSQDFSSAFTLISGRKRYWQETTNLVLKSRNEVLRIVDENGLKTMFATDLFEQFKSAARRGVSVKLISEITASNLHEAKTCAKYFKIKHLGGLVLRFIDVDSSSVILCGSLDKSTQSESYLDQGRFLKFHDCTFGKTMKYFFDELWTIAEPIEQLIVAEPPKSSNRKTEISSS